MGIYNKLSQQMVVDLLNASNPSLPIPIDLTQVKFATPTVIASPVGIQDTQVRCVALASGQYAGNMLLTYRRLDLTALFRSIALRIDLYSAAGTGSSPYKMSQLLPYINAKYGLNLQTTDITDVNFGAGNTNANAAYGVPAGTRNSVAALSIATGNPAWKQVSINVCWVQAPQDLGTLLAVPSLETALTFPGQRNVVDSTVYVPNMDSYYYDFTDQLTTLFTTLSNIPTYNGLAIGTNPATQIQWLIQALNALSGKTYTWGQGNPAGSQAMDLTGALVYTNIDLTLAANQALYPESDYKYYNKMALIKLQSGNTWGAGDIMMHYNV